ncbi:MAG: tyrosine-type recombinase/integrase [Spirochaetia bacterium]|nr:tyrosine-type recombinase/integrase [Spirochaetia bacterium]
MGTLHLVDFNSRTHGHRQEKRTGETRGLNVLHRAPVNPHAIDALRRSLASRRDEDGTRSHAMLLILLVTGMRASELVLLKRSDFRRDDLGPLISFYRPKRRDRHVIRLSEKTFRKLIRALDRYHAVAGIDSDHVFWSCQVRRAGIPGESEMDSGN